MNTADLMKGVLYGAPPRTIVIRINGSDKIGFTASNGDSIESRVLRVMKNSFNGASNVTLKVSDGDYVQITRDVWGWGSLSTNGVQTLEKSGYKYSNKALHSVDLTEDLPLIELNTSLQHKAVQRLVDDIIGPENLAAVVSNISVTNLRIENTLKLNKTSQESGIIYECSGPGKGKAVTVNELELLRERFKQDVPPEGAIYVKVPTEAREVVLCGNPETVAKYLHALNSSVNYILHKFDDTNYAILPNVQL